MDKTVAQVTTNALRLVGQLWLPGGGPSPEAIQEVTDFLNQLLDSWSTMRNSIYALSDLTFLLTSGKYIYTVGPGGDLNGPRPIKIQRMDLLYQTSPQILRLPIDMIDADQWASVRVPNLPNAVPLMAYYDRGYSQTAPTGLGVIYFWPGPMAGYSVEMWIWGALPSTLLPDSTLFLPPGYARAISYNLACEIMPLYPKRLTQSKETQIVQIAMESKRWVDALNAPKPITEIDPRISGGRSANSFNWLASTS